MLFTFMSEPTVWNVRSVTKRDTNIAASAPGAAALLPMPRDRPTALARWLTFHATRS
jgi:hypothetical protein